MSLNVLKKHKRWTAQRKFKVVIELLKGLQPLEEISRQTGVPAHELSSWRDDFLNNGAGLFKEPESPAEKALAEENQRLKAKVGEITLDNDLLYEKIRRLENGVPFHLRKSKK